MGLLIPYYDKVMKKLILATLCLMGVLSSAFANDITIDGTVVENQTFTSQVSVKAHNVVIRNCEILMPPNSNNGWYGISNVYNDSNGQPRSTNLLIENCIVRGGTTGIYVQYATVKNCNIQEVGKDAMKVSTKGHCRILGNYVARLGLMPGSHADGIQLVGGSHVIIAGNTFDIPVSFADANGYGSNACVMIHNQHADVSRIIIVNNYMNGGSYSVYLKIKSGSTFVPPTHCRITNNVFTTDHRFGALSWSADPWIQINGNRWDDGTLMNTGQWDINTWDSWPNQ